MSETSHPTADQNPAAGQHEKEPQAPARGTGDNQPDKVVDEKSPTADR